MLLYPAGNFNRRTFLFLQVVNLFLAWSSSQFKYKMLYFLFKGNCWRWSFSFFKTCFSTVQNIPTNSMWDMWQVQNKYLNWLLFQYIWPVTSVIWLLTPNTQTLKMYHIQCCVVCTKKTSQLWKFLLENATVSTTNLIGNKFSFSRD